jgi:hypothetical protein
LEGEVSKQQHRIDKLLSPHFSKNSHLLLEIRKEIEKSVLVRQLKAQVSRLFTRSITPSRASLLLPLPLISLPLSSKMLSLRGTITEKEIIIESLQKKTSAAHLIELSAEKEEYFYEIKRLRKALQQKEKELQQEKDSHGWQKKGENVTLEGPLLRLSLFSILIPPSTESLKAEITRLSRGYQQVLERLESTTTAAQNPPKLSQSRHEESDSHSSKPSSSRPSSGKSRRPKSADVKAARSKVSRSL